MKKVFLLLFSIISLSAAVQAQDSATGKKMQPMRQQRADMMQQLNLTDEQKVKFKKLREGEKSKIDSIQTSTTIAEDQKPAQIRAIRLNGRKAMEDMLTPEQKSKMMQMHSGQMERRKGDRQAADSTK